MRALEVMGTSAGGIRRHVGVLVDGLEARGWEVDVVAPPGALDGLVEGVVAAPVVLGAGAVRAVRTLRPLVAAADVVHAHGLTAGWIAWAAGAGPKLVVTVHNLVLDEASGRTAPLLRALEGQLPGRARETIVISEEMRQRFDPTATSPHVHVVAPAGPVPVPQRTREEVRSELRVPDGVPLVVLVGRLHPQKDIGTLIDAVAALDRPLRAVVVGEGPAEEELRAQVVARGVGERVALIGRRDDAASYQAAADVVVMCSLWEGFGLVVAEALHLGRPVVATDVGPVAEMVHDGETGRLVPVGRPDALAAALADLLDDPEGAAAMGAAGAKLVAAQFDADVLIDGVVDVYHLVAKASP